MDNCSDTVTDNSVLRKYPDGKREQVSTSKQQEAEFKRNQLRLMDQSALQRIV